jgi:AcrR family transcriptional regulator
MTSEERKLSIVHAAMRLFGEKGFRGTTTRELAAAVGVSEPVLYEHFKTKRELYAAIIECVSSAGVALIAELIQKYENLDDDAGFFTELGMLIVEKYTRDPTFIRLLLFSNLENHEMRDLFHERGTKFFFKAISGYIAKRMEKGAMRQVDPDVAARAYAGMIAHYALTGLVFGCGVLPGTNEEVVRAMVGIFLGGLCDKQ